MALDMNIQELLVIGDSDLLINQVKGNWATKNVKILLYVNLVQRLCERFKSIDFRHTPRAQNEFADSLAIISSMIQHPESTHIDPLEITLREEQAHCAHVEAERMANHGQQIHHQLVYSQQRRKAKLNPVERDQKGHNRTGNKDTSGRKGHRANERKDESDQKGHTKGEQQKISDREGHN
ncbi:uncharacterized protein LOC132054240 [Lycium ferocissimum]|uniref:uncharacterized protein LOC132054240 n=1 Tax=Lycium ferocissimum TaxID=112874 RepID=UPI0028168949|nr:uncharacterized protein LOC132054240 [Lycium ferocissimum]